MKRTLMWLICLGLISLLFTAAPSVADTIYAGTGVDGCFSVSHDVELLLGVGETSPPPLATKFCA